MATVLLLAARTVHSGANLLSEETDWNAHSFAGETRYTWLQDAAGSYVCGEAEASASLRMRRVKVDLTETPILTWRWRVPLTLPDLPQQTRAGDDFPARIYVVARKGLRPATLVYIWGHSDLKAPWPNPFDTQTIMIPMQHGESDTWWRERADVRADLELHFGLHDPLELGIGFMTDADNSGGHLNGCYRDLMFEERAPEPQK